VKIILLKNAKVLFALGFVLLLIAVLLFSSAIAKNAKEAFAAPALKPIYSVDTQEKKIAISFDAAWGADKTAAIMDICDNHNVKATFFLVGFWIDKYPDMVKQIDERGFEIGNHSLNHPKMTNLSKQQMIQEIEEVNKKIKELTNKTPTLFRPPFGAYNNAVVETVQGLNMHCIQWSVDSLDWQEKGVDDLVNRTLKNAKPGGIILFHNNAKYILDALPKILQTLQKEGYSIVSVGDLIYKDNYYVDQQGIQRKKT